jgi:regulatory protein
MNEDLLNRLQAWCAKAERSSAEVTARLTRWGVAPEDIPQYLDKLVEDKFIDDERFLGSFVLDHWRIHGWGKVRIAASLAEKGFEEPDVERALRLIPDDEYDAFRQALILEKAKSLPFAPPLGQAQRLLAFALGRGLEEEWVREWLEVNGYMDE